MIDLHIHSTFSDGLLTIEEIIEEAKRNDTQIVSITDHDNINNISYIYENSLYKNLTFIPGTELSTESYYLGNKTKIHLLGYGFDSKNQELNEALIELRNRRALDHEIYINELVEKFRFLNKEQFKDFNYGEYGWIKKLLLQHLKDVISSNEKEELINYLDLAKPNYRKYNQDVKEAIKLVKQANGYAVLAHPYELKIKSYQIETLIKYLKGIGLDGIETYHSSSKKDLEEYIHKLALKYKLFETCGSDFHCEDEDHIVIGHGINNNINHTDLPIVKKIIMEHKIIGDNYE